MQQSSHLPGLCFLIEPYSDNLHTAGEADSHDEASHTSHCLAHSQNSGQIAMLGVLVTQTRRYMLKRWLHACHAVFGAMEARCEEDAGHSGPDSTSSALFLYMMYGRVSSNPRSGRRSST